MKVVSGKVIEDKFSREPVFSNPDVIAPLSDLKKASTLHRSQWDYLGMLASACPHRLVFSSFVAFFSFAFFPLSCYCSNGQKKGMTCTFLWYTVRWLVEFSHECVKRQNIHGCVCRFFPFARGVLVT